MGPLNKAPHSSRRQHMKSKHFYTIVLTLFLVFSVLCLPACSPAVSTTAGTLAATTTAGNNAEQTSNTSAETTGTSPLPMDWEDLDVEIDGVVYQTFGESAGLIAVMGEPVSFAEAASCLFEGTDKTYEFEDIVVYTITSEGVDLIDGIDLITSRFATRRGITVGSTKAEILAAYGEPDSAEYDIVYSADPSQADSAATLTFIMDGDVVAAVSMYSGSNNTAP